MNQSCNLFKKTASNFIVLLTAVITIVLALLEYLTFSILLFIATIVLSIKTLVKIIKISIECLLDYFVKGEMKNERD